MTSNERRFAVRTAMTPDWVRKAVEIFRVHAGEFNYFSSTLDLKEGGISSITDDEETSWRAALDDAGVK